MKKRILSLLCVASLILSLAMPVGALEVEAVETVAEDVVEELTVYDALTVLKHLAQIEILSGDDLVKYDFDGDGIITIRDALFVLRSIARL
jgi:hypothetical protein